MGNTNFKAGSFDAKEIKGKCNHELAKLNFEIYAAVSKENFVYHHCIGKGGFGRVYRCELGGKEVAVKRLAQVDHARFDTGQLFEREVKVLHAMQVPDR